MSSTGHTILRDLIKQFPNAGARTIAQKAYRENPEVWTNPEACRTAVRAILGVQGKKTRKEIADKSLYRAPRKAGWSDVIPEALKELRDWKALEVPGIQRALILSDCHLPYHEVAALELALEHGAKQKPNLIILNGDILDCFSISRWENAPRQRDFPAEVRAGKFFLQGIRKRFPKARILWHEGNHEARYFKYLRLKAPDLLGVPDFEWESLFDLATLKIEYVKDMRPIRLGKLNIVHGHEFAFQISSPVNPARGFFLRSKTHVLGGHLHRTSQHSERSLDQKIVSAWSTGCLCNAHPSYRPINDWNHGAAFVITDKDGGFHVENFRIVDGSVW